MIVFVPPNYVVKWWVEMVVIEERMRVDQELEEGRKLSEAVEIFFQREDGRKNDLYF